MSDLSTWFNGIPFFTRYWFGSTVLFCLLGRFNLISQGWLFLQFEPFIYKFQIWRPFTALFYYPMGFHLLMNLYFLYNYSGRLEREHFVGRPAEHLFMLLFCWLCSVIVALISGFPLLMDPMVMAVLYMWCQLNRDLIVTFWFGLQFKAMYFPWVLLCFQFVMGGGGIMELMGIIIGHLYFFLTFKYPQDFGGASLLTVPQILYDYFPNQRGVMSGFGQAPVGPRAGAGGGGGGGGGFFGGQGHRLG